MPLGKHIKTDEGTFRRERGDSLVRNLKDDYPILEKFDDRTKLETLRNRYGVNSLNQLIKKLKNR